MFSYHKFQCFDDSKRKFYFINDPEFGYFETNTDKLVNALKRDLIDYKAYTKQNNNQDMKKIKDLMQLIQNSMNQFSRIFFNKILKKIN